MEHINNMQTAIRQSISHSDQQCQVHGISLMQFKGDEICPRCYLEAEDKKLQQEQQRLYEESINNRKYKVFENQSLIEDHTLIDCRLHTYPDAHVEEKENKRKAEEAASRLIKGDSFNVILQGKQGTGKSGLAYSILYHINENSNKEKSCLFASVAQIMRLIRQSFNEKHTRYTESYFIDLLSSVDVLCLDDLGAETGAIDSERQATNFVQRVLYEVTNARQSKATILTTNLTGDQLRSQYDSKLISRLFKNPYYIVFKDSPDKRITGMPF